MGVKSVYTPQVASAALSSVQPELIPQPKRCSVGERNAEQLRSGYYGYNGLEQSTFFPKASLSYLKKVSHWGKNHLLFLVFGDPKAVFEG